MLSRFFGKSVQKARSDILAPQEEELLIVPVPSLVAVLLSLEEKKGQALTEEEVNSARDCCACIAMPASALAKLIEGRGYSDLDPENIWEEWQRFLHSDEWREFLASKGQP